MNVKEFMDRLKDLGFNMDKLKYENKYIKNKDKEVKVGLYARISKKDKNNTAIKSQFMAMKFFIEDIDPSIKIIEYYDNGISGTTVLRDGYTALVKNIEDGTVNVVFTTNIDRFGRRVDNILSVLYPQSSDGFIYASLDEMLVNTWDNREKVTKYAMAAEEMITKNSTKARRTMKTRMKCGSYVSAKALYGMVKKELNEKVTLEPARDETTIIVKEIFNSYLTGKSIGDIAKDLSKKGYKTPTKKDKWKKGTIESILKNIKYAGVMAQGIHRKKGPFADGESSRVIKLEEHE